MYDFSYMKFKNGQKLAYNITSQDSVHPWVIVQEH